jgi:hypothetical protein
MGTLPELRVLCANRPVVVMLDSNADSNPLVRRAKRDLVAELLGMRADVRVATVPDAAGVNGPDDLVARARATGPGQSSALLTVLDNARLASEVAARDALDAIGRVEAAGDNIEEATPLVTEAAQCIATVQDRVQRAALTLRLRRVARQVLPAAAVGDEVERRTTEAEARTATQQQEIEELSLRLIELDMPRLIDDLENFFADRVYLPEGGPLALAYFVMNSYVFRIFDTCPYLALDSPDKRCGKNATIILMKELCFHSMTGVANNLSPVFRKISDGSCGTLLIPEAKSLEGEHSTLLLEALLEGYKKGGKIYRCEGDDHHVAEYDVFCQKGFACIGTLHGPLLDRCISLHMERRPRGMHQRTSRLRVLKRDAEPFIEQLRAYAVQYRDRLQAAYDSEPDEGYWPDLLADREAEVWGPLMLHARMIGPPAEAKLRAVVGSRAT